MFAARNMLFAGGRSYRSEVLADSPVGYWRLGEASGTTAADEMGSYAGTYVGSPTLGVAGAVAGNNAVTFNGSTQYVNCGGSGNFSATNQFTLEFFAKLTNPATTTYFLAKANDSVAGQWYVGINGTIAPLPNQIIFRVVNGTIRTGKTTVSAPSFTDFRHVAVTWNAGTFAVYIDGIAQSLQDDGFDTGTVTTLVSSAVDTNIGRRGTGGAYSPATIDDVSFYNTALSADRILAHYNARNRS